MRYVYLPVLCFLVGYCSSVTKIETLNRSFTKPKFVTPLPGESEPLPSGRDYKERLVNKSTPHFFTPLETSSRGVFQIRLIVIRRESSIPSQQTGVI